MEIKDIQKLTLETYQLCAEHHDKMTAFHLKEAEVAEQHGLLNHAEWHKRMVDLHTQICAGYAIFIKAAEEHGI